MPNTPFTAMIEAGCILARMADAPRGTFGAKARFHAMLAKRAASQWNRYAGHDTGDRESALDSLQRAREAEGTHMRLAGL